MKEVQLIRKSELSEGGLVDSLALAEGFTGEDIYEMFSEVRQLKKGEKCIEVHHESPNVRFKRGDNEMIFKNHVSDHTELYEIVNQILSGLFELGPYEFKEENGNPKLNEEWQETIETQRNNPHLFQ